MDKEFLKNKIEALRHDFVESTSHERAVGFLDEARMSKKMIKIKKKLVSLEMPEENWAQGSDKDWSKDPRTKTTLWGLL